MKEFYADLSHCDVWVWGAKVTGISVCYMLKRLWRKNISGVIDDDVKTHFRTLMGTKIIGFDEFKRTKHGHFKIFIASAQHYKEIASLCDGIGLHEGADYINAFEDLGPRYEIDLLNICNLRCPSCPQGNYPHETKKIEMSLDYFNKLLDKILIDAPNTASVSLFCWSENFLKNDLNRYIEAVKKRNLPCFLSTNFNIDKQFNDVVQAGPDYIRISLSGYFQNTYCIDHCGGNINLVKSNMYKLRYLIDKYRKEIYVEVAYHKYKYNQGEDLSCMQALCDELNFTLADFFVTLMPIEHAIKVLEGEKLLKLSDVLSRFCINLNEIPHKNFSVAFAQCPSFVDSICIMSDGTVMVCNYTFDKKLSSISDDYLKIKFDDIKTLKSTNITCKKCAKYGLPRLYASVVDDIGKDAVIQNLKRISY